MQVVGGCFADKRRTAPDNVADSIVHIEQREAAQTANGDRTAANARNIAAMQRQIGRDGCLC